MSDCPKCDDNPHPQRPEPKVACKHDDPPHAEVPCEFKTLGTHWELRKEEGDCPLIRVLGEDGQPCWYRVCEVAEGETGPEEDSPSIIYDCLGRYWKLQAGKDAADIAAAMACALEAKAAIAAIPTYEFDLVDGPTEATITWTVDGVPTTFTIVKPQETDGVHFSGQPTFTGNVLAFPTANDADESPAAPFTVDFTPFVSDPAPIQSVVGTGDVTVATDPAGAVTIDYSDNDLEVLAGANVSITNDADGNYIINVDCMQQQINGCGINGTVTPLAKGDGVLRDTIDPFYRARCPGNGPNLYLDSAKSGGHTVNFAWRRIGSGLIFPGGVVPSADENTPVGTVLATSGIRGLPIGDCGGYFSFSSYFSVQLTESGTGQIGLRPEYSLDCVTWTPVLTGAVDVLFGSTPLQQEFSFTDFAATSLQNVPATAKWRVVVATNSLANGSEIELQTSNGYWDYAAFRCCPQ